MKASSHQLGSGQAWLSGQQRAQLVRTGEVSAVEVTRATLEHISRHDTARAFTALWPEEALTHAADVDRRRKAGQWLPLAGVPIGVKASEGLTSHQAVRLMAAGCVAVGATSVPGPGTDWQTWGTTAAGPTLNPHNPAWSPGGSSAGSAVAVASGLVPLATGSDGAGSVRIPAAWCSVLGLKPTNGLIPARDRAGLNIGGPLARTAADAACYLDMVAGTNTLMTLGPPLRPLRTTWSSTLGFADTVPRIAATARRLLEQLAGHDIVTLREVPVRLTDPEPCWRALRTAPTTGPPHGRTHSPPTGSRAALDLVSVLRLQLDQVLTEVDLIATPTTPGPPHGHDGPGQTLNVALTWTVNITGHPAISIPAGLTAAGEPVGLQLIAAHHREADLLAIAHAVQDFPDAGPISPRKGTGKR